MIDREVQSRITRLEHGVNALRLEVASAQAQYRDIATNHDRLTKIVADFAPAVQGLQDQILQINQYLTQREANGDGS